MSRYHQSSTMPGDADGTPSDLRSTPHRCRRIFLNKIHANDPYQRHNPDLDTNTKIITKKFFSTR